MKKAFLFSITVIAALCSLLSLDVPSKWHKSGNEQDKYNMGIAARMGHDGGQAATIESKETEVKGFGTLMQNCTVGKYAGKRVRMSGYMRSVNVDEKGWAGFWFRVDGAGKNANCLAFKNMYNRPVKGTTDWKQYEIILDVPANASALAYGALLAGTGRIWFDDIRFEILGNVTSKANNENTEPTNLSFEE